MNNTIEALEARIVSAKLTLSEREQALSRYILYVPVVIQDSPFLGATDGTRLMLSQRCHALTDAELEALILHELSHIWLAHNRRFEELQREIGASKTLANMAADLLINHKLIKIGYQIPAEGITLEKLKGVTLSKPLDDYHLEELILELMAKEPSLDFEPDVLEGEDGNAGEQPQPHTDQDSPPAKGNNEQSQSEKEEDSGAAAQGEDNALADLALPLSEFCKDFSVLSSLSGFARELGALLPPPKIDWARLFRPFLRQSEKYYYSAMPAKRSWIYQYYLPRRRRKEELTLFFVIDTSGSMSAEELTRGVETLASIVHSLNVSVYFMAADDEIRTLISPREFKKLSAGFDLQPHLKGGGGTDFTPALHWIQEKAVGDAFVVLYITDGYGRFPTDLPKRFTKRLFWVVPQLEKQTLPEFPYGKVMPLTYSR